MVDVTDLTAGLRSRPFIAGEIWEFDLQHSRGRADRGREEEVSQLQVSYCGAMASEAQAIVELVDQSALSDQLADPGCAAVVAQ